MRLCTLCKIVSMSKQYSGTVGLKTKINLATRYYIIKGSFKGQANRKPSGIFSGTSAASLIYHFLQENLNFSLWDDDVLFSLGSLHRHCTLGGVARKWPETKWLVFLKLVKKVRSTPFRLTLNNAGFLEEFFGRNEVCLSKFSFKWSIYIKAEMLS